MLAEQMCPGMGRFYIIYFSPKLSTSYVYTCEAIATRLCDANGQWGPSNVLGCTSPEFSRLRNLVSKDEKSKNNN